MSDVCLFIVEPPGIGGPWFESEWNRHFKVKVFSITRHKLGFDRRERDLVAFSTGINESDRLLPGIILDKNWALWRSRLQKDILTAVRAAQATCPIDLCFAYGDYTVFEPNTLSAIRNIGVPVALLCLDEKHTYWQRSQKLPNGQKPLIGSYDVHLTNSFESIRWYLAEGAAAYYFPQAADPEFYGPLSVEKDIPVSFVGKAYGARLNFIRSLWKAGIPIVCYGLGWPQGPVDDLLDIYRRSIINLGVGATGLSERMSCIKGRDFEVPAIEGFYLTTYDYELSRLFDISKEIVCYHNSFDCVDLIRYFLENLQEAKAIGRAARRRILQEHTWTHRMEGLLRWMGILL
jgi:hypothetical protein